MSHDPPEPQFRRFCRTGDAQALANVFDRLAPELLLVAAHLAGGDSAEDLVQQTFVDAIEQRMRWDETRPLAPWLVGILANHVRQARRERARMPDPQRLPKREVEGPEATAAAHELADAVHAAVERLPLPYRQVLSLRLVHGLELQQIAHSLGVPLGTVKTRLHRGTALLRRALPAGLASAFAAVLLPSRGLAAVRAAVLGHAQAAVAAVGATVGGGILLGGLAMKKGVLAVAALLAVLGGWWATTAGPAAAVVAPVSPTPIADAATARRVAPPAPGPLAASVPADARQPIATTGGVELEVVWKRDEAPAAGVELSVHERRPFVRGQAPASVTPRNATTDTSGRARWSDLAPGPYSAYLVHRNAARPERFDVVAGDVTKRRLVVDGDLELHVAVVDREGRPAPDVSVWVRVTGGGEGAFRTIGVTDRDGTLQHRGWPVHSVWARRAGSEPSRPVWIGDAPGEREIRLQLGGAGGALRGRVLDPEGHAVPNALVVVVQDESATTALDEAHSAALSAATDDAGRFAFDELFAGERLVLAFADGCARAETRVTVAPATPGELDLRLRKGATITGRVTTHDGQAAVGATLEWSERSGMFGVDAFWERMHGKPVPVGADGGYRLQAVTPSAVAVLVKFGQEPDLVTQSRTFDLRDGEVIAWDVVLPEGGVIDGRVVDARDEPLADWCVSARGPQMPTGTRDTRTDRDGRFRFTGLIDQTYGVQVYDGKATGAARWVRLAGADAVRPPANDLVLRVLSRPGEPCWLTGRIVWPEGVAKTKVSLPLYPANARGAFAVPAEHLDAGADTFRIGPLPPDDYLLRCEIDGRGALVQRGLRLLAGETREVVFDLTAQHRLRVVLRHTDGRAAAGGSVQLKTEDDLERCTEDRPGEYLSPPVMPGAATGVARGPDFAATTFALSIGADPETRVEHAVVAATPIEFRLRPPGPARDRWIAGLFVYVVDGSGGEVVRDMVQIDGKDRFVWRLGLARGSYTVQFTAYSDGQASVPVQVGEPGAAPLVVDVQLQRPAAARR